MRVAKDGITAMWLIQMFSIVLFLHLQLVEADDQSASETEEEDIEPVTWILFFWFSEIIGIITFFLLARYCHALPYTAVMFLFGTFMGIGLKRLDLTDQLTESLSLWSGINGELLLVFFLPGLIFKDAFGSNVHLVALSFSQCLIMAFPLVLAGTSLTALVAFYIFPYNWSFNLSMTLGSILSATDPVAVSALLDEVGAPPRLKAHISGESLLNDGSAMVFYTIFSSLFLYEYGLGGEEIDGGEGVKLFVKLSLGAMGIGIAFGLALVLILFMLNRKLNSGEDVVQVVATITIAYLTFYVADPVAGTSGVIAVIFCGYVAKAFGIDMINDIHMMESFWILVENILNSVLFTLGGLTWGTVIANTDERQGLWTGQDWGYLVLFFVLLTVIRFLLLFGAYPLYSRIGLKSRWQECFFQSYSGLRGAVGIALAIQLDNTIFSTSENPEYQSFATKVFGMVGGIAFMTLIINGTTAGPLLLKLGLADDTKMRKRIVESFRSAYKEHMLDSFIQILTKPIYSNVSFAIIRAHHGVLADLTADDIREAAVRYKASMPAKDYVKPYLANLLKFLEPNAIIEDPGISSVDTNEDEVKNQMAKEGGIEVVGEHVSERSGLGDTSIQCIPEEAPDLLIELRKIFVEMLRSSYHEMIEKDELDGREGFVTYAIMEGLEFTDDVVSRGMPLNDFSMIEQVRSAWTEPWLRHLSAALNAISVCFSIRSGQACGKVKRVSPRYEKVTQDVHMAVAVIRAHSMAEVKFHKEFCKVHGSVDRMEKVVLYESQKQARLAEHVLETCPDKDVIISHLVCRILFHKSARYVKRKHSSGFLKEGEAQKILSEIQDSMLELYACPLSHSEDEMETGAEEKSS